MNNGLVVRNVIFINRAPFEKLDLKFIDGVNVLSSENGRGKTTIMSYIVDALYEMARDTFNQSFEGHETSFYRISSNIEVMDKTQPSVVYIRFEYQGKIIDYVDIRGGIDSETYGNLPLLSNRVPYSKLRNQLEKGKMCKYCHFFDASIIKEKIFSDHIATYFPAYRYELPAYINEVYQMDKSPFNRALRFQGYLPNPIEVITGIDKIADWLLDVVLDMEITKDTHGKSTPELEIWRKVGGVLGLALLAKKGNDIIRFGIGRRTSGESRVSVIREAADFSELLSPSISYLSSGEKGLLCIFGEILRQSDRVSPNIKVNQIDGMVMVDEIDKHLHIRQQKEALPQMMNNFPNIQFIVSSHSPFLNIGLADDSKVPSQIIDLDSGGTTCEPRQNELYNQVYEMMLHEKADFAKQVEVLQQKVASITKPIILTEGKTDWKHIKHALKKLQEQGEYLDVDIVFDEFETDRGDTKLQNMCTALSQFPNSQKIIAIYDTDKDMVKLADGDLFKRCGNNVYELPIPNPQGYSCGISIEMMYPESDIKRVDANGRRLFLTSEFNLKTGALLDGSKERNCHNNALKDADKRGVVKIIDQEVYDVTSGMDCALSKEAYAMYILTEDVAYQGVDVSGFRMLFDTIKQIIND